ncbi:MAG: shikimate dehydrogenase [Caldilineaceae bacterium]
MRIFPRWMEVLGRPEVVIEGIDHRLHDDPEAYRTTVAQIKEDPLCIGGLVTTHKMDLYAATHDLFDGFDNFAQLTHELSCISKHDGRLKGHALDPITAGITLDSIVGPDYFGRTGAELLCLGAGGAASALLLNLISRAEMGERPLRFVAVDRSQARLDHLAAMVAQVGSELGIETIVNSDPRRNDALMANLPTGSLVINATGMGKDLPGSPITDASLFPQDGIAWEFNYRGELDFLHQALRQQQARNLRVEDGWVYFLHGWTRVIAEVLQIELTNELFAQLAAVAEDLR